MNPKHFFMALLMVLHASLWASDIRLGITPNPANNQAIISVDGASLQQNIRPEIFTVLGKKVAAAQWRKEGNAFLLNTTAIPDGVYLIKLSAGSETIVKRLRIQHQ